MTKEDYQNYLNSPGWAALRAAAYRRAGSRCELCGKEAEAIHHIKYPKNYSEDTMDNLLAVCKRCHMKLHGIDQESLKEALFKDVLSQIDRHSGLIRESENISETISESLKKFAFDIAPILYKYQSESCILAGD